MKKYIVIDRKDFESLKNKSLNFFEHVDMLQSLTIYGFDKELFDSPEEAFNEMKEKMEHDKFESSTIDFLVVCLDLQETPVKEIIGSMINMFDIKKTNGKKGKK